MSTCKVWKFQLREVSLFHKDVLVYNDSKDDHKTFADIDVKNDTILMLKKKLLTKRLSDEDVAQAIYNMLFEEVKKEGTITDAEVAEIKKNYPSMAYLCRAFVAECKCQKELLLSFRIGIHPWASMAIAFALGWWDLDYHPTKEDKNNYKFDGSISDLHTLNEYLMIKKILDKNND